MKHIPRVFRTYALVTTRRSNSHGMRTPVRLCRRTTAGRRRAERPLNQNRMIDALRIAPCVPHHRGSRSTPSYVSPLDDRLLSPPAQPWVAAPAPCVPSSPGRILNPAASRCTPRRPTPSLLYPHRRGNSSTLNAPLVVNTPVPSVPLSSGRFLTYHKVQGTDALRLLSLHRRGNSSTTQGSAVVVIYGLLSPRDRRDSSTAPLEGQAAAFSVLRSGSAGERSSKPSRRGIAARLIRESRPNPVTSHAFNPNTHCTEHARRSPAARSQRDRTLGEVAAAEPWLICETLELA